jgi:cell division protein ZipA
MDDLRLILLLIGVGLILAVYAWTRFQQRSRARGDTHRAAGGLRGDPDADDIEEELARMQRLVQGVDAQVAAGGDPTAAPDTGSLQVISVVAQEGARFSGEELLRAFEHNALEYSSERGIYQRTLSGNGAQAPVFGTANLVKPGTFPALHMDEFSTPGITLFLQLPAPIDAVEAFDDFVNTAERLAVELAGVLRDERHNVLTHQALMQVRETIVEARLRPQAASS